jgi:hypothetical protein
MVNARKKFPKELVTAAVPIRLDGRIAANIATHPKLRYAL